MSDTQMINQLKFRVASLQSNLSQKQKALEEYKSIQTQADLKIKGLQKIHSQKIKSLLNSIQILKKQKASIQGLSKQHKRSKLIQQLNRQILDQDLAIEVLRKVYYKQKGVQQGRVVLDDAIIKAFKKGPERIRPLTREELRMEIDQLKEININLEKKLKLGTNKKSVNKDAAQLNDDTISQVSSILSESATNGNQNNSQKVLQMLRQIQLQKQNLKLESSSKTKIIDKLKTQVKQSQKFKAQYDLLKNQVQILNRKLFTYQKILKQSKQSTNKKLIDLYERELKVQELQMVGKENNNKIKSLEDNHNVFLQEIQLEKEQLQLRFDQLKQENQKLIFDSISTKKHQDNQKAKIDQIKQINQKQKTQLSQKLKDYESQVQRIMTQNSKLKQSHNNMQSKLFSQRGQWVQQKQKLINQLNQLQLNQIQSQKVSNLMIQIDRLKQQNSKLQKIFAPNSGQGVMDDKLLLSRLQNYKRKLEYYQGLTKNNPNSKSKQIQMYNQLFQKYNQLSQQFVDYKRRTPLSNNIEKNNKHNRKQIVQLNRKQNKDYQNFSSGLDSLNLLDVDSDILDNFDTSYEYSIHINQDGHQIKMPKISQADKQLLKLMNSDLWYFVKDDPLTKKIQEASLLINDSDDQDDKQYISQQMRKFRNMSHPQGQKITLYEEQLRELENISDSVSITSAMDKQINQYDSDVNLTMQKMMKHAPSNLNYRNVNEVSMDIGSDVQLSGLESDDSNIRKKKKKNPQKASKLNFASNFSNRSSQVNSQLTDELLNSDVSSINISQRQLNRIQSDLQTDFRKKKT